VTKVIINGEYAHHRCDCCGKTEKGTPWVVVSPAFVQPSWSEDTSAAPSGWSHVDVPFKKGSVTRNDLCPNCKGKKAEDIPPDF
jgi:hypothetical protein